MIVVSNSTHHGLRSTFHAAYGIRTRVTALRGRRPGPLDECGQLPEAVPKVGVEPTRGLPHYALNVARLPVPPLRLAELNYRQALYPRVAEPAKSQRRIVYINLTGFGAQVSTKVPCVQMIPSIEVAFGNLSGFATTLDKPDRLRCTSSHKSTLVSR